MKLTNEETKRIRAMADKPDGYLYYEEIIEQLNSSSKLAKISIGIAVISVIVAVISLLVSSL